MGALVKDGGALQTSGSGEEREKRERGERGKEGWRRERGGEGGEEGRRGRKEGRKKRWGRRQKSKGRERGIEGGRGGIDEKRTGRKGAGEGGDGEEEEEGEGDEEDREGGAWPVKVSLSVSLEMRYSFLLTATGLSTLRVSPLASGEGEENLSMLCDLFMTNWLLSFAWMSGVSGLGKAHPNIRPWESLALLPAVTQSGRGQGPTPHLQQENAASLWSGTTGCLRSWPSQSS